LGNTLINDSRCLVEIYQIAMAKKAFTQKRQILMNKNLSLKTRKTKTLQKLHMYYFIG